MLAEIRIECVGALHAAVIMLDDFLKRGEAAVVHVGPGHGHVAQLLHLEHEGVGFVLRVVEAALVAPFEYAAMPLAIFWGIVIFGTWPDATAALGIALICGAGLYTLWRETRRKKDVKGDPRGSDL